MIIMAGMLSLLAMISSNYRNPSAVTPINNTVVDSPAPEYVLYGNALNGGVTNVTNQASAWLAYYGVVDIEQSLVGICRSEYFNGLANNCSPVNEGFTWDFLLQNGNTGNLSGILGLPASNTFSCANAQQYGVYLFQQIFGNVDLTGRVYDLINSQTGSVISGSPDPCAYADIVS